MERRRVTIRKYENRRLYDTANSRYINLDEVAQMVRDGVEVQVLDASTGEDLTRLVLTQIIVEEAKAPDSTLPLDILRQMVMATGRAGQDGMLRYMKAMFDVYQNAYRALTPSLSPLDFLQSMAGGPRPGPQPRPAPAPPPEDPAPPAASRVSDDAEDVRELKRRIEELEKRITKSAAKPRKRTRRSGQPAPPASE